MGLFPEEPDATLNISKEKHNKNIKRFKKINGISKFIKLDITSMGDYEVVISGSFIDGKEYI